MNQSVVCDARTHRRGFMQMATLSIGGSLLTFSPSRASDDKLATGKSVILLFQHGGPSQFETFDPKPEAPAEIRSVHGNVATSVPGVVFGGGVPKLAKWAHRLTVVRSFQSGSGAHEIRPVVCRETLNANMGALVASILGSTDPRSGMPRNVGLFPSAVDEKETGPITNFGNFEATGDLGLAAAPFLPGAGGQMQEAMKLRMTPERMADRRSLLSELDQFRRRAEASESKLATSRVAEYDSFRNQAFDVIEGGIVEAFDWSREAEHLIDKYDTFRYHAPELWDHKNNRKRYSANAKTLGKLLLLARRLAEAGCSFITISTDFVWDMHADVNNLGVGPGTDVVCRPFDHAVSAFIEDCETRGLTDKILFVATGEMGRTPKINKNGGRDHWGRLTPLLLYGGAASEGRVIGQSSRDGGEPGSTPITIHHLLGTIMQTLLDVGQVRLQTSLSQDVLRAVTQAPTIPGF